VNILAIDKTMKKLQSLSYDILEGLVSFITYEPYRIR